MAQVETCAQMTFEEDEEPIVEELEAAEPLKEEPVCEALPVRNA